MLCQNGFRITIVQMTIEQGSANRHNSVTEAEFNDFSAETSTSYAIPTETLLNSIYKALSDVCLQL